MASEPPVSQKDRGLSFSQVYNQAQAVISKPVIDS
jgi:hypothetical protein